MDELRTVLLRTFPQLVPHELVLTPLVGGITNRNYTFDLDGRRCVVREPGERTELLGIDRAHEAEAADRAAEIGIGPPVVAKLPEYGTLITELVPGQHQPFPSRLADVVKLVRAFHESGPLSGVFPIHRVVEWHARDAVEFGVPLPASFDFLRSISERIERVFVGQPLVACHNDLLPSNVLFDDNRVWLLDFEYAGMNSRHFDLGNLSVNCGFDGDDDEALLSAYFGDVRVHDLARLRLMKIMSEFREGMWGVVQQGISNLDTDFVSYAHERLSNAVELARAVGLEQTLVEAAGGELPKP
jgi:thiamine kinase-like enzyme